MIESDERPTDDPSILSSLPGTRPQRRSPKRSAGKPGRSATPTDPAVAAIAIDPGTTRPTPDPALGAVDVEPEIPAPAPGSPNAAGDPPAAATPPRARRARSTQPAAAQGFEADPIVGAVDPPTGAELLASVAQGATELAQIGVTLGRRLARSVLDRIPGL
jgi:hypothetical protein